LSQSTSTDGATTRSRTSRSATYVLVDDGQHHIVQGLPWAVTLEQLQNALVHVHWTRLSLDSGDRVHMLEDEEV
jgi:hypothetical protein